MNDNIKVFMGNLELLVQAINYVQSNSVDEDQKKRLMLNNQEVISQRLEGLSSAWSSITNQVEEEE